jgi:hypothetical protein
VTTRPSQTKSSDLFIRFARSLLFSQGLGQSNPEHDILQHSMSFLGLWSVWQSLSVPLRFSYLSTRPYCRAHSRHWNSQVSWCVKGLYPQSHPARISSALCPGFCLGSHSYRGWPRHSQDRFSHSRCDHQLHTGFSSGLLVL